MHKCTRRQRPQFGGKPASKPTKQERTASRLSRLSRAEAVSVNLTRPLVVSADLTRQVLVGLRIVWPFWTASVHAGHARRRCGRVGRAAVIRQRHRWPARTPPGRPQRGGQVSCRCMKASGLLPTAPSPATLLAGQGFHRRRARRHQVSGTAPASGLRRPRSSGTSGAVPLPGGVRSGRAGRPCPRAGRPPGRTPRPIAPASAVPTVHRAPRARSRARRWSPAAAPAGQPR